MRNSFFLLAILITAISPALSYVGTQSAFDVLVVSEKLPEKNPVQNIITFYQNHISPYDGPRCMLTPTCSQFYKKAHNQYGFIWGTLMTIDRLFYREGQSSLKYYRYNRPKGTYEDPVYHNYIFNKLDYYK
jgi:hypothetical protein